MCTLAGYMQMAAGEWRCKPVTVVMEGDRQCDKRVSDAGTLEFCVLANVCLDHTEDDNCAI